MPYKDPEKRREAHRRWAKKHRAQHRERQRIQKAAALAHPVIQPCSIEGCDSQIGERHHPDYDKPKEIVWLCKYHHESLHHSNYRRCALKGCDRKHWAKGLCHMHLKRSNPKKYSIGINK